MESESKVSLTQLDERLKMEKAINDELTTITDELREALKKSRVDALSVGDNTIEWAKDQILCLHSGLAISEMDYFKVV